MASETSQPILKATDWILIGLALISAGVLITSVNVLGWQAFPTSPWGVALANFFYTYPLAALVLVLLGLPPLWKGSKEYRQTTK